MRVTKPQPATQAVHRKFLWIRQVCTDPKTRHLACRVAALMLDYINLKEEEAWPSQKTLAVAAGVTPRAVQSALCCLEKSGHITVRRRPGLSNRYRPRLTNDRSRALAKPTNEVSRSHEPGFVRFQETPLNKSERTLERATIGREMVHLASRLRGGSAATDGETAA